MVPEAGASRRRGGGGRRGRYAVSRALVAAPAS